MSKIVFFSIPAWGHINPTLAVISELVSQGHQVWYYAYNKFREEIEKTGATFVSCDKYDAGMKLEPEDGARIAKDMPFAIKVVVNTTLALDEKVTSDMAKIMPDCIVSDSMAFWGKAVAKKLGIPYVCSNTTFAFNRHSAKTKERKTLSEFLSFLVDVCKSNWQIRLLRKKGYPIRNVFGLIANKKHTDTIVYTSREFQPCADTFSDKYAFVGPLLKAPKAPTRKRLDKLIYIAMGSVNNNLPKFYEHCVRAFELWDGQVIMSVGDRVPPEEFSNVSINIFVYDTVDQISVLEKTDLFITHCGLNSVSEALSMGIPLVMIPQTDEQIRVAERVAEFGAGVILNRYDYGTLQKAAAKVFSEPSYKENAEKVAEILKNAPGAKGAVEKIMSVIELSEQKKAKKNK